MIIRSKVIPESDEGRLLWCHKELINISNRCIRECSVNMIIIWKKDACTWLIFPSHFKLFAVRKIKLVNLKGNQPWLLIGRTDAEAETPVFWSSDANSWLIGKAPDVGKDWGQKEKRASEDEMTGWNHWCNGHELGQTSGVGKRQRGLVCCSSWGHKELNMTQWLNNNNNSQKAESVTSEGEGMQDDKD